MGHRSSFLLRVESASEEIIVREYKSVFFVAVAGKDKEGDRHVSISARVIGSSGHVPVRTSAISEMSTFDRPLSSQSNEAPERVRSPGFAESEFLVSSMLIARIYTLIWQFVDRRPLAPTRGQANNAPA